MDVTAVTNVAIWGNHSATQYPDFYNAKINGQPGHGSHYGRGLAQRRVHHAPSSSAARRSSRPAAPRSAASAANAIVDSVRSIIEPTAAGDWHSVCLCSDGSYGVEKGLISSFPVRTNGAKLEIVQGLPVNEFSRAKIDASVKELKEEKSLVGELLPK